MTAKEYLRDYQHRLLDATILARAGLADPTPSEQAALDALSEDDEDLWTLFEELLLLPLPGPTNEERTTRCLA